MASVEPTSDSTAQQDWQAVSSQPLMCTQCVESPHPYPSSWMQREDIHFPGDPTITSRANSMHHMSALAVNHSYPQVLNTYPSPFIERHRPNLCATV